MSLVSVDEFRTLADRVHELEQERAKDQAIIDMLRQFDVDLLQRHLKNLLRCTPERNLWSTRGQKKYSQEDTDKQLWSAVTDPEYPRSPGYTPERVVQALLLAGADPNACKDDNGETLLHKAVRHKSTEIVDSLLDSKAAVDAVEEDGETPLRYALRAGHEGVVTSLLAGKADVNVISKDGESPFHYATDRQSTKEAVFVSMLARADVNLATKEGETPLHIAAKNEDYFEGPQCTYCDRAALLLASKADVNVISQEGKTPLDMARNEKVKAVLREHGGKVSLFGAALENMLEEVAELIKGGADVNQQDKDGETPLHCAAGAGHEGVVTSLLASKAAVDAATKDGKTPLHCAAGAGHEGVVTSLLASKAAVDAATKDGKTPLHCAAGAGHEGVVNLLIGGKAAVDAVDESGKTPLHLAAERAFFMQLVVGTDVLVLNVEEVPRWRAFVSSGGDQGWITFADSSSESHELKVEEGSFLDVVSLGDSSWCGKFSKLGHGIITYITADYTFPVDAATRASHEGVVTSLLASKASVAIVSKEGKTPLDMARNEKVKAVLREHGGKDGE